MQLKFPFLPEDALTSYLEWPRQNKIPTRGEAPYLEMAAHGHLCHSYTVHFPQAIGFIRDQHHMLTWTASAGIPLKHVYERCLAYSPTKC